MSRGPADRFEMVELESGRREFIAIGVPTRPDALVHMGWAMRVFGFLRHPMNRDVRIYTVKSNDVALARNEIVWRALRVEEESTTARCSHVFFIDDDVLVHPDVLLKLLADARPIVSGLYYAKTSVPQPLVLHGESDGVAQSWTPGDLVECWAHGMGLTLIQAEVFRRLRDETALGTDADGRPQWFATTRDAVVLRSDGVPAMRNQTEDVHFLRRAAALGYVPTVDTSPQAFGFHWAQAEQRAYPLTQWFEYQQTGQITWPDTPAGPVTWAGDVAA